MNFSSVICRCCANSPRLLWISAFPLQGEQPLSSPLPCQPRSGCSGSWGHWPALTRVPCCVFLCLTMPRARTPLALTCSGAAGAEQGTGASRRDSPVRQHWRTGHRWRGLQGKGGGLRQSLGSGSTEMKEEQRSISSSWSIRRGD